MQSGVAVVSSSATPVMINPNWRSNLSEHHRMSEDYTAGVPSTEMRTGGRALSHSNMIDHLGETDEGSRAQATNSN